MNVFVFSSNKCIEGIVQRMKTYKDPDLNFDVKVSHIDIASMHATKNLLKLSIVRMFLIIIGDSCSFLTFEFYFFSLLLFKTLGMLIWSLVQYVFKTLRW